MPEPNCALEGIYAAASGGKLPISCFIIAKNEAHRIERCIASVIDWVDEVIVVEDGSNDATVAVAESAGARVIKNRWPGFGQQKRFAEDQCRHTWVLNLDADEEATPDLKSELAAIFDAGRPKFAAYWMDVHIVYPGWRKPRLWARDHKCIRFYDRSRVRFRDSCLHDSVEAGDQPTGRLSGVLWHHTFASIEDLTAKCDERATYSAVHSSQRSLAKLRFRTVIEWPLVFAKYYFARRHFTGGHIGLHYCLVMAHFRRERIKRMLALDVNRRTEVKGFAAAGSGPGSGYDAFVAPPPVSCAPTLSREEPGRTSPSSTNDTGGENVSRLVPDRLCNRRFCDPRVSNSSSDLGVSVAAVACRYQELS